MDELGGLLGEDALRQDRRAGGRGGGADELAAIECEFPGHDSLLPSMTGLPTAATGGRFRGFPGLSAAIILAPTAAAELTTRDRYLASGAGAAFCR